MTYDFPVLLALVLIVRFCVKSLRLDYPKPPEPSERNFDSGGPVSFDNGGPVTNTETLVVGQDVYMVSGCYWNEGKVVKVTPSGVDVQTAHELLHFDANGRSYVTELPPSYDSTAHPMSPWRWGGNGTYECGPWYIDDMPFAERTAERTALRTPLDKALLEQGTRKDMKTTLVIGQDVYVVSNGGYSRRSRADAARHT
jgi:hypothetical protein